MSVLSNQQSAALPAGDSEVEGRQELTRGDMSSACFVELCFMSGVQGVKGNSFVG